VRWAMAYSLRRENITACRGQFPYWGKQLAPSMRRRFMELHCITERHGCSCARTERQWAGLTPRFLLSMAYLHTYDYLEDDAGKT
jgi:hypothetical protein